MYHDRVSYWIEGSYLADSSTSKQHLAVLTLVVGLSMNGCISWLDDYKFHAYDSVWRDWVSIFLEWYFLADFPVIRHGFLTIMHVSQVSILAFAQFFVHILITVIFVFAGWELMQWLH